MAHTSIRAYICSNNSVPYHFVKDGAFFFPLVGSSHQVLYRATPKCRDTEHEFQTFPDLGQTCQTLSQTSLDTYPLFQIWITYL